MSDQIDISVRDAEIEDIRAELEAARAEIERKMSAGQFVLEQLAAEQAKNVELLEIAKKGLRHYENRNIAHGTRNPAAIALDEIAATPSDISALEAIVKKASEVMRDKCAKEALTYGCAGRTIQDTENAIRALPAVTLEDLK